MRLARVLGTVTLGKQLPELIPGQYLLAEALDAHSLRALPRLSQRTAPMPESLVIFDQLGAGVGQIIALSEGREAAMPFHPQQVPIDAYCAAILDQVQLTQGVA